MFMGREVLGITLRSSECRTKLDVCRFPETKRNQTARWLSRLVLSKELSTNWFAISHCPFTDKIVNIKEVDSILTTVKAKIN